MTKWLLVGALLGLLIVFPSLLAVVVALVAAILGKPVVVAFAAGLLLRPHLPRVRRWAP
ncbi:hypothetical protein OG194_18890 [Streptomyces sp. NBC_01288]|uniref:hypothetical protein n=1 Tax=Streptomyces sp. NBC_01288 TaxID=2903814 RepID=UPI002E10C4A2|nr:hypothetical protein OG194_18890 [Streptomyces sp. NBC_01288]